MQSSGGGAAFAQSLALPGHGAGFDDKPNAPQKHAQRAAPAPDSLQWTHEAIAASGRISGKSGRYQNHQREIRIADGLLRLGHIGISDNDKSVKFYDPRFDRTCTGLQARR